MTKRIGYQLSCDRCAATGATVYVDEGAPPPKAESRHLCKGTQRPTWRPLKYRGFDEKGQVQGQLETGEPDA